MTCPKCAAIPPMSGPYYHNGTFSECLKYICRTCGYEMTMPCKDAEPATEKGEGA